MGTLRYTVQYKVGWHQVARLEIRMSSDVTIPLVHKAFGTRLRLWRVPSTTAGEVVGLHEVQGRRTLIVELSLHLAIHDRVSGNIHLQ